MNRLLLVCLLVATISAVAQAQAQTQPHRRGVSVQMAVTRSASPMPEADNFDAWIVTVAADGSLYFRIDPMTPDELAEWMKAHPRNRDARLYIKADARAPFASVEKVLEIGRATEFATPVLLTAQAEHNAPGTMVPPKGVDVSLGSTPSGTIATLVELLPSGQEPPLLINNDQTSWSALENALTRRFQKGDEKLVLLRADAGLPFAVVVRAIDSCRAAGAKVHLAEPGL